MNRFFSLLFLAATLAACGNDAETVAEPAAPEDTQQQAATATDEAPSKFGKVGPHTSKLQPPVRVNYRVIGEPIVGQPVAVDLQLDTNLGSETLDLAYRINDSTALQFPESQPLSVAIAPTASIGDRSLAAQQVTVIPMREGRLFLNVAVSIETETGSWSSVTAVPIEVGQAPRELLENGTVTTDENGELIRSLPAQED